MYNCSKCRKDMLGTPALKNNAGEFCDSCKEAIYKKSKEAIRLRNVNWDKKCLWCKNDMTELSKSGEKVCYKCQTNRDWLLHCIRQTERPFNYVQRIEQREKDGRADRIAKEEEKKKLRYNEIERANAQAAVVDAVFDKASGENVRIDRIESLLLKLIENLGGVN